MAKAAKPGRPPGPKRARVSDVKGTLGEHAHAVLSTLALARAQCRSVTLVSLVEAVDAGCSVPVCGGSRDAAFRPGARPSNVTPWRPPAVDAVVHRLRRCGRHGHAAAATAAAAGATPAVAVTAARRFGRPPLCRAHRGRPVVVRAPARRGPHGRAAVRCHGVAAIRRGHQVRVPRQRRASGQRALSAGRCSGVVRCGSGRERVARFQCRAVAALLPSFGVVLCACVSVCLGLLVLTWFPLARIFPIVFIPSKLWIR